MKYINVTIWGYPLYSDTFSYVWQGFAKAFKAHKLVARVIWLEDTPENCLKFMNTWDRTKTNIVLCEGHQATFLPIATDATYFVHCPKKEDIERYQKAKKFIDLRYHCDYQDHPVNYNYVLDTWKCQSLGPLAHYENNSEYDRLYLAWATDLLPEEFDYNLPTETTKQVPFVGTIYSDKYQNQECINGLKKKCFEHNLEFIHIDPWTKPLSMEENYSLVRNAFIAPDIRGPQNIQCGYIPCRIFKNISYGQLGITNSRKIHSLLKEATIYHPNVEIMFDLAIKEARDIDRIKYLMKLVEQNHTYVQRVKSLLQVVAP